MIIVQFLSYIMLHKQKQHKQTLQKWGKKAVQLTESYALGGNARRLTKPSIMTYALAKIYIDAANVTGTRALSGTSITGSKGSVVFLSLAANRLSRAFGCQRLRFVAGSSISTFSRLLSRVDVTRQPHTSTAHVTSMQTIIVTVAICQSNRSIWVGNGRLHPVK